MKQRLVYLFIIILLGLVSMACGLTFPGSATATPVATPTQASTATQAPTATAVLPTATPQPVLPVLGSKSIQEKNTQASYTISGEYMVMQGDPAVAGPFNLAMDNFIQQTVSGFKQDVLQAANTSQISGSDLEIHFSPTLISGRTVSIIYMVYVYYAGAAHPNSYSVSFNYDISQKRMLELKDLFNAGADYLDPIANYCGTELKKSLGDAYFEDGALPKDENYKNWNLLLDGLQISFDPYQVGPYAVGPQKVLVPMDVLKEILLPDGLFNK
jgi:hypothetical protein